MQKEKILVNQNEIAASAVLSAAQEAAGLINSRLTPALLTIGLSLTDGTMKDCLLGAKETEKNYFDNVEKDIKNTRTPSIKKQLEGAAGEAWETFAAELSRIRKEAKNYRFLTVENGLCVLTPDNKEKLLDTVKIYLTEPAEIEAYKLHVEIIEKLNKLFNGSIPYRWQSIFVESASGQITRNDSTNYQILATNGK